METHEIVRKLLVIIALFISNNAFGIEGNRESFSKSVRTLKLLNITYITFEQEYNNNYSCISEASVVLYDLLNNS